MQSKEKTQFLNESLKMFDQVVFASDVWWVSFIEVPNYRDIKIFNDVKEFESQYDAWLKKIGY